jgi:hypothetical protein
MLELDLCGEVICRAPLAKGLTGKVTRGLRVRLPKTALVEIESTKTPTPSPKPTSEVTPVVRPDELPYSPLVPAGYEVRKRTYPGLVALGWVGFSISYSLTVVVGIGNESSVLFLPVLGPLLYLATANDVYSKPEPAPYVLSSLLQGVSIISLIAGYRGETKLVKKGTASISLAPSITRDGGYFGVVGRF